MHKFGRSYDPYGPCVTFGIFRLISHPSTVDFSWYPLPCAIFRSSNPCCYLRSLIRYNPYLFVPESIFRTFMRKFPQITFPYQILGTDHCGMHPLSNHCHVTISNCSLCLYHMITLPSDPHGLVMVLI